MTDDLLEMIQSAARVISPVFRDTPQFAIDSLNARLGLEVLVKIETMNPIRSFKGRGCDFLLHRTENRQGRLVTASAGNFGQGLAYAAKARGARVTVFAAETASPLKIERMRAMGAVVTTIGHDLDAAKVAAREWASINHLRFVEDGREPEIAAGAGTIAVELLRHPGPIDAIFLPMGNGALAAGVGCWVKAHSPRTRVVGVVASGAPCMRLSFRAREPVSTGSVITIADGIAVRQPVPEAVSMITQYVNEVVEVTDEQLLAAMRMALGFLGVVVEPAGAAGLAGVISRRGEYSGARVAVPICGGNMSPEQSRRWLG